MTQGGRLAALTAWGPRSPLPPEPVPRASPGPWRLRPEPPAQPLLQPLAKPGLLSRPLKGSRRELAKTPAAPAAGTWELSGSAEPETRPRGRELRPTAERGRVRGRMRDPAFLTPAGAPVLPPRFMGKAAFGHQGLKKDISRIKSWVFSSINTTE